MVNLGILKYTLQKYLKSLSLWIIILIGFLLIFILAGVIGLNSFNPNDANPDQAYMEVAFNIVILTNVFISGLLAIFVGIFGAKTYREDIDNGSFLIIVAKPISKKKIIFSKYLAFLMLNIAFTFLLALFFIITIAIFDSENQIDDLTIGSYQVYSLTSKLGSIFFLTWAFLLILALFFSGVALFMSAFISGKGVIGLTIGLSLFFQTSGLIEVFTKKQDFEYLSAANTVYLNGVLPDQEWGDIDDPISFYNVGITNKQKDNFKSWWFLDFNYHRNAMASIVTNSFFSSEAEFFLQETGNNKLSIWRFTYDTNSNYQKTLDLDNHFLFDKMIVDSWNATSDQRITLAKMFQTFLSKENPAINLAISPKLQNLLISLGINNDASLTYDTLTAISNLDFTTFNNNEQAIFFTILLELSKLYEANKEVFSNLNQEAETLLDEKGIDFPKSCRTLFAPLHWLNDWLVNDFQKQNEFEVDLEIMPNNFTDQTPMLIISNQISSDLRYQVIGSAINQGYQINKIQYREYGDERNIIIAYLSIGLILIIGSFLIMIRKNI